MDRSQKTGGFVASAHRSGDCGTDHACVDAGAVRFGLLAGGAIGVFLLFYGRMTGGSVGYGDGCLFIMTGIFLGFWRNLELLVIASLLAACYAGYLVVAKKKTKGERFPFVPFVWISSIFLWF